MREHQLNHDGCSDCDEILTYNSHNNVPRFTMQDNYLKTCSRATITCMLADAPEYHCDMLQHSGESCRYFSLTRVYLVGDKRHKHVICQ
jgi:hypothetical protein